MSSLFRVCYTAVISRTARNVVRSSISGTSAPPSWETSFQNAGVRTVNLQFSLSRSRIQCYSSKIRKSSRSKSETKPVMKEDREALFIVRKGDLVGVYKSLGECQSQVGTSVCDPPVSVYKGYSLAKDGEEYLRSCGLKHALYSIRASDVSEELFGDLIPCSFQQPSPSGGETSTEHMARKRPHEMWSEYQQRSCTVEFDGASKGNPGQAGAGAVLRADDGSMTWRVREGLGIATNNVAEYRGMILGLKHALDKGFTSVRARGDSKLVCMQIQGLWKVKNQNISPLFDEVTKLKDRFLSFQIVHVLRDSNSEADAQANMAVELPDGEVQEDFDK